MFPLIKSICKISFTFHSSRCKYTLTSHKAILYNQGGCKLFPFYISQQYSEHQKHEWIECPGSQWVTNRWVMHKFHEIISRQPSFWWRTEKKQQYGGVCGLNDRKISNQGIVEKTLSLIVKVLLKDSPNSEQYERGWKTGQQQGYNLLNLAARQLKPLVEHVWLSHRVA